MSKHFHYAYINNNKSKYDFLTQQKYLIGWGSMEYVLSVFTKWISNLHFIGFTADTQKWQISLLCKVWIGPNM